MAPSDSPMPPDFDSAFAPRAAKSEAFTAPCTSNLLAPPASDRPETPIRRRERSRASNNTLPANISWAPSKGGPRIETPCDDCSGDEVCPLHDFISGDLDATHSDSDTLPTVPPRVSMTARRQRPKLRLKTPAKVQARQLGASTMDESKHSGLKRPGVRRAATDDAMEEDLPSGSTLLGSGSTPGSASKKWGKQRVSFAVEGTDQTRSDSREPLRPHLQRNASSQSRQSSRSSRSSQEKPRGLRRLFFFERFPSGNGSPQPEAPTDYMARRESHNPQTPVQLPRRISRLPSFFTRERLILPERIQRRDVMLLSISVTLVIVFMTIGIIAVTRPDEICQVHWMSVAIDSFLPNLVISATYIFLAVGFAVSQAGRRWINGRYTPLLYAMCVALGRVAVGALSGNISWKVLHCKWGGA